MCSLYFIMIYLHIIFSWFLSRAEEVVNEDEKTLNAEKLPSGEEETTDATKETPSNETEEKEPENKVMIFSII